MLSHILDLVIGAWRRIPERTRPRVGVALAGVAIATASAFLWWRRTTLSLKYSFLDFPTLLIFSVMLLFFLSAYGAVRLLLMHRKGGVVLLPVLFIVCFYLGFITRQNWNYGGARVRSELTDFWIPFMSDYAGPLVVFGPPPVWIRIPETVYENLPTGVEAVRLLPEQQAAQNASSTNSAFSRAYDQAVAKLGEQTSRALSRDASKVCFKKEDEYLAYGDLRALLDVTDLTNDMMGTPNGLMVVGSSTYEHMLLDKMAHVAERKVIFIGGPTANHAALSRYSSFLGIDSHVCGDIKMKNAFVFMIPPSGTDDPSCAFIWPLTEVAGRPISEGGILKVEAVERDGERRIRIKGKPFYYKEKTRDYGMVVLAIEGNVVKMIWPCGFRTGGTLGALRSLVETAGQEAIPEIQRAMSAVAGRQHPQRYIIQLLFETSEFDYTKELEARLIDSCAFDAQGSTLYTNPNPVNPPASVDLILARRPPQTAQ